MVADERGRGFGFDGGLMGGLAAVGQGGGW